MEIKQLSPKQLKVLSWWHPQSPFSHFNAIICDGAVRSGKTFSLSLSFLLWSFFTFRNQSFAFCGKTIGALHRNVITPLLPHLQELGFEVQLLRSQNLLVVRSGEQENRYYLFGGKDESSADYIQGITLAGVLFDEVALLPRSFVEQALARCSVDGSRFWFNCNPETPYHWFYKEWILKQKEKQVCYLHFTMEDNPALSPTTRKRYQSLYQGAFYQRYVLGKWTQVQGAVYPMFSKEKHVIHQIESSYSRYVVSCDYGTTNPSSFGLWGYWEEGEEWHRLREYYHCSRTTGILKTDEEYADELEKLIGDTPVETIIVDPSAASFIQCLRRRGQYSVTPATNHVIPGIRLVGNLLQQGKLKFHESCVDSLREFSLYSWKEKSQQDAPLQKNDHAMDDIRYFAQYAFTTPEREFYALSSTRTQP